MVVAVIPDSNDSCPNRKIRTDGINDKNAAAKAIPAFSRFIFGKYNERGSFSSLSMKIIGCSTIFQYSRNCKIIAAAIPDLPASIPMLKKILNSSAPSRRAASTSSSVFLQIKREAISCLPNSYYFFYDILSALLIRIFHTTNLSSFIKDFLSHTLRQTGICRFNSKQMHSV